MGIREENFIQFSGNEPDSRFDFKCGHCGKEVSGRVISAYRETTDRQSKKLVIYLLCPSCLKGSVYMDNNNAFYPGINPGTDLKGLPPEINEAYEESRRCFSVNAYTACELLCRKILMHIAVEKGANEGEKFAFYLDYLEKEKYVTPPIKKWADLIRQNGNSSTHDLSAPDKTRAEITFTFTEQLLKIIYEMEYLANKYIKKS